MQGQQLMIEMIGLDIRSIEKNPDIYNHHQCIVSNVNPLSQRFMIYCLNIRYHMFKTGSRRLKQLNVSEIPCHHMKSCGVPFRIY